MNAVAKFFPEKQMQAEADAVPAEIRAVRAAIASVPDKRLRSARLKLIEAREARAAWSIAIEQASDENVRWKKNFAVSGIIPLTEEQTSTGRTAIQRYEKLQREAEGHDKAISVAIAEFEAAQQDYVAALYVGVRKHIKGAADVFSAAVRALEGAQAVLHEVEQSAWSNGRSMGMADSLGRERTISRAARHAKSLQQTVERI